MIIGYSDYLLTSINSMVIFSNYIYYINYRFLTNFYKEKELYAWQYNFLFLYL